MNVECSNCGSYFELHDGMGQKTKCPYCHQVIRIRMVCTMNSKAGMPNNLLIIMICCIAGWLFITILCGIFFGPFFMKEQKNCYSDYDSYEKTKKMCDDYNSRFFVDSPLDIESKVRNAVERELRNMSLK